MKKIIILFSFFLPFQVFGWGVTGHRVVGDIAEQYLNRKARKEIHKLLGDESLAIASTWMDEIKSDSRYDHTHDWHWVTVPESMTYDEAEKNSNGDIIQTIECIIRELKQGNLTKEKEVEHLKMLVHLVGDIHQPLHVGTGEDKGGNEATVVWFQDHTNLHRVWDSGMIDEKKLSYTELSSSINHLSKSEIKQYQSASVRDWAYESMALRDAVYNLPEDKNINYEYAYHNYPIVEQRLLKAGIRLAGVLNDIYG